MARQAQQPAENGVEEIFGGTPAPLAMTETPEFKAAVQEAAAEAAANAVKEMMAGLKGGEFTPAPNANLEDIFGKFASAIADLTYQGDKRNKPIDPKILEAREAAQKRLDEMLLEIRRTIYEAKQASYEDDDERDAAVRRVSPKYRIISKVHLGDMIINPFRQDDATHKSVPVEIFWAGEPNDAMRPRNALAKSVFAEFRQSRGNRTAIEKKAMGVKAAWMTDKGLIIEGGTAPSRRGVVKESSLRDEDDGLDIPAHADPEMQFINVLGTIAEPARRNYQGKPL